MNSEEKKENNKRYYKKNKEKVIKKVREYQEENKDKISEYQKENAKKWAKKNPNKINKATKEYRKRNPEKKKAWIKVERKIKIEGLCVRCKKVPAQHRHHPDYSKPLLVQLICRKCHKEIHSQQYAELNSVKVESEVKGNSHLADTPEDSPNFSDNTGGSDESSGTNSQQEICNSHKNIVGVVCDYCKPKTGTFNLSEKRKELFRKYFKESSEVELTELLEDIEYEIEQQDKEFIKRLKVYVDECHDCPDKCEGCLSDILNLIDKHAGKEMVE
ncbi:hypothetical protein LCGC14_1454700 [marine sediment metagenome]|uniref:HNH domain-containing protein n=1 Tax=marine sediment metagenome TaxID=412755 RepID=A0A0F9LXE0_9ZZZZ